MVCGPHASAGCQHDLERKRECKNALKKEAPRRKDAGQRGGKEDGARRKREKERGGGGQKDGISALYPRAGNFEWQLSLVNIASFGLQSLNWVAFSVNKKRRF